MWAHAAAMGWWAEVRRGVVWGPLECSGNASMALELAVRGMSPNIQHPHLQINMIGGDKTCWKIARLLEQSRSFGWDCTVGGNATSAGLILTCACEGDRICRPHSIFTFHGDNTRHSEEDDQMRSRWFAEHTKMPVEFWLEHCADRAPFEFGAEEAVEYGVVGKIIGGPKE